MTTGRLTGSFLPMEALTLFDMDEIKAEESEYGKYPLPVFYKFPSKDARERILYNNYAKVNQDVKDMIQAIVQPKETTKK